jgi:hypothetical protein
MRDRVCPSFRVRPQRASAARCGGRCSRRRLVGARVNARHRGVRSEVRWLHGARHTERVAGAAGEDGACCELSSLLTVKTLTGMTTDVYPRDNCIAPATVFIVWTQLSGELSCVLTENANSMTTDVYPRENCIAPWWSRAKALLFATAMTARTAPARTALARSTDSSSFVLLRILSDREQPRSKGHRPLASRGGRHSKNPPPPLEG